MGNWFNRQDFDDNREPEVIERERLAWRRRWVWTLAMGLTASLLGGLLGLVRAELEPMLVFMFIGLVLGLVGGWVAGSVDIWPRNMGVRLRGGSIPHKPYYKDEENDEEDK